ncbi:MAG TPA: sigma-70 family RNA polymerase sigma factor [Gemmataceae bacterium]|nr:sigma-70 family RNA polymerase sigma factor [Gemmataceae bacterium]
MHILPPAVPPAFARAGQLEANNALDLDLATRYRAGDQRAAAVLYRRYGARLLAAIRSRCGRSFASRFDPEDVAQMAFRSLFDRLRVEEPDGDVWGLLLALALNHVRRLVEHHSAAKRSVWRTCIPEDDDGQSRSITDNRCTDTFAAIALQEQLATLTCSDRQVVELRLAGYEVGEISGRTGRPRRTVERVLHAFRLQVTADE